MKDNVKETFDSGSVPKTVFSNIIPSVIGMIMVLVYNLADTFFIGRVNNPSMVAAVSIATPVFLMFMSIGMLFGIGGTTLISRLLGENKRDNAKHVSSFCFWTSLAIGIIGMIAIVVAMDPVCQLIGANEDTMGYVKDYLGIVAIGIPFLIVSNMFSSIIRAEGNPTIAMMGMIIGNLANVILDPIMILGFGWNVKGAAIATVIGNVLSTAFYIYHLVNGKSILSIKLKDYKASKNITVGVLSIGIPASISNILMSCAGIILNIYLKPYGTMALAGYGVGMKVNMIVVMILIGIGTGVQPLLGYCYGAGKKKRFNDIMKFSAAFTVIVSIILSVGCYFGAGALVKAFLQDESAYAFGVEFARILIVTGPILGLLFLFTNTIQALGAAMSSLILSISRQGLLYIPILFVINKLFDSVTLLIWAQPIADFICVILSFVLFIFAYKKAFKNKLAE